MKMNVVLRENGDVTVYGVRTVNGRKQMAHHRTKGTDGSIASVLKAIKENGPAVAMSLKPPHVRVGKEGVAESWQ